MMLIDTVCCMKAIKSKYICAGERRNLEFELSSPADIHSKYACFPESISIEAGIYYITDYYRADIIVMICGEYFDEAKK